MADVIAEADEVRAALEQVREETETLCGLGVDELEQLGHLDDGGGADDADAQTLGDGKLDALGGSQVDIVDEGFVANGADEGFTEVGDGFGEIVRDGLDSGA